LKHGAGRIFVVLKKQYLQIIVSQQELKNYLEEAPDGVIYFRMGSLLQGYLLPESKRNAFLEAVLKLKQRVLWKCCQDS